MNEPTSESKTWASWLKVRLGEYARRVVVFAQGTGQSAKDARLSLSLIYDEATNSFTWDANEDVRQVYLKAKPFKPTYSGYQRVDYGGVVAGANVTGLANNATAYTADIDVDGATRNVSVIGSDAQTFAELLTQINNDIPGATCAIVAGDLVITSNATGAASTIAITDNDLFSSVTDFDIVRAAFDGGNSNDNNLECKISFDSTSENVAKAWFMQGASVVARSPYKSIPIGKRVGPYSFPSYLTRIDAQPDIPCQLIVEAS